MSNTRKNEKAVSRRSFMQIAGLGAGAAGAMALGTATGSTEADAADSDARKSGGYRETDHIRTYYEYLRF